VIRPEQAHAEGLRFIHRIGLARLRVDGVGC
jgi:hypothetical protein